MSEVRCTCRPPATAARDDKAPQPPENSPSRHTTDSRRNCIFGLEQRPEASRGRRPDVFKEDIQATKSSAAVNKTVQISQDTLKTEPWAQARHVDTSHRRIETGVHRIESYIIEGGIS